MLKVAAVGFAVSTVVSLGAANAQARPAGGNYKGCAYGAVCIYPGASYSGTPKEYYSYGYHNLSGEYGTHRILNNQYGGAIMRTCTGSNGTGCQGVLGAYQYEDKNMTPINSIVLAAHS